LVPYDEWRRGTSGWVPWAIVLAVIGAIAGILLVR
jgi:hypothetical protein